MSLGSHLLDTGVSWLTRDNAWVCFQTIQSVEVGNIERRLANSRWWLRAGLVSGWLCCLSIALPIPGSEVNFKSSQEEWVQGGRGAVGGVCQILGYPIRIHHHFFSW